MSVHTLSDHRALACACGSVRWCLLQGSGIECHECGAVLEHRHWGPDTADVGEIGKDGHDYGATIDWTPNPLPTGTELYAAPQQRGEPVAWFVVGFGAVNDEKTARWRAEKEGLAVMPLYASPQRRKPLTEAQIEYEWRGFNEPTDAQISLSDFALVVRAVEAAHGIKETQ